MKISRYTVIELKSIELFHVMSSLLENTKKGSCNVGVQRDISFYGDLGKWKGTPTMFLLCVKSDEIYTAM